MPPKHDESSPCGSQNTENGLLSVRQHELCPHESSSCLSHLERLAARFSDPSIRSLAGATSGVASSVVICPLDVMKTKLQGRGGLQLWTLDSVSKRCSFQDRGLIGTGRAIWHEGGLVGITDVGILKCVRCCWRYLLYIIHESLVVKYLYKECSETIPVRHRCRLEDICFTGSGLGNWHEGQGWLQILGILTASSASKACATIATYPHEVIRTRLQTQQKIYPLAPVEPERPSKDGGPSVRGSGSRREKGCNIGKSWEKKFPRRYGGIISTLATIMREERWRAFYSGMGTSLIGAIPASATAMLVYEAVVRLIKQSRKQGKRKLELQDTAENCYL
ncbi:mitochondrial carrier domain-containing protein [Thelonectria olida]|uniref:Mitochondrial carrier domain-containing protein n=1 Tax=Thelonectria olida TaxID=1576542 RepID=A0A9P8VQ56_9HYPO|nr:mitochondrial carrier domain-containing protein [Thelonectria olida]